MGYLVVLQSDQPFGVWSKYSALPCVTTFWSFVREFSPLEPMDQPGALRVVSKQSVHSLAAFDDAVSLIVSSLWRLRRGRDVEGDVAQKHRVVLRLGHVNE